LVERQP